MRCLACLVAAAFLGVACGDDPDSGGTGSTTESTIDPSADAPASVAEIVDGGPSGDVGVLGYVVIDQAGTRLCAVLLESFPPQCGPPSIELTDLDVAALDLQEEQAVQWTDDAVVLRGRYDDGTLTVLDVG